MVSGGENEDEAVVCVGQTDDGNDGSEDGGGRGVTKPNQLMINMDMEFDKIVDY